MRLRRLRHGPLDIEDWELTPGQTWCVLGGNASGKSLLGALLAGEATPPADVIENRPPRVALLSFETLQAEYERELAQDDTDFLDRIDYGATGLELLLQSGASASQATEAAAQHGLARLLARGCRQFSTGELRRLALLRETLRQPDLLILDEPYEGLDPEGRSEVATFAAALQSQGHALLLLVNRVEDVAPWCSHLALLRQGRLIARGPARDILASPAARHLFALEQSGPPEPPPQRPPRRDPPSPLFELRQGRVAYGDQIQFHGLDWRLQPGQHTLVTGPNGCGKSTLLALVTGDHPQCYCNDIRVLGYVRGTGESIWDIKRKLGIVSPALHRDYRVSASVEAVVVSGFYDSVGLYHSPSAAEIASARRWLAAFALQERSKLPFHALSYGQQRLALIARALVKQPPLLILDEPTQGLDDLNRHLVLASLQRLAALERCTLLFVSHRQDERLPLFRQRLEFRPDPTGQARFQVHVQP